MSEQVCTGYEEGNSPELPTILDPDFLVLDDDIIQRLGVIDM